MPQYEYKVVPAPTKGRKAKGVRTPEGRFANSVEWVLNAQAGEGWEYVRSELLPSDERSGLTGSTTNWRNVLVFRRLPASDAFESKPQLLDPRVSEAGRVAAEPSRLTTGADAMQKDNGVEDLSEDADMTASLNPAGQQTGETTQGEETYPENSQNQS